MADPGSRTVTEEELVTRLHSLPTWPAHHELDDQGWARLVEAAKVVQATDPAVVESALDRFVLETLEELYAGAESESKAFLLLRVVFELPESAPVSDRRSFKGWTNWPEPGPDGTVSLSWPVSWRSGWPRLVAPYEGSMGPPYDAGGEYRELRSRFPYRQLG
jgi:hypothetical protein